ncbi:hypothetical protein F8R89_18105 [Streptomyces sp. SS1-1]|nr:hypothetical protein F8R89_18105 [Streptomyces sp. SS1-1]
MQEGRGAGVAAAGISLITQLMFIPYYPLWALPMMALDLASLFALTLVTPRKRPPDHWSGGLLAGGANRI